MLRTAKSLKGFKIHASDGDIGRVEEFLFDDSRWVVRYLAIKTGGWLSRKEVLLTPLAICEVDWDEERIEVSLTREQVAASPPIESDQPVSRQKEIEYFDHFRLPYYWTGAGIFGIGPTGFGLPTMDGYEIREEIRPETLEVPVGDPHLRSSNEIAGYGFRVQGEKYGHIADVVIDDRDWTVRYLLLDHGGLERGHAGLVSPGWVKSFSWSDREVQLDMTSAQLEQAPVFESIENIGRDYEERLHQHFNRRPYWIDARVQEIQSGVTTATWSKSMKQGQAAS